MGRFTNLATGSVVSMVVGGILLLSHPAGAGEPWYCPKGDFVFAGTSLKAIGDAYYIYAGASEVFTARYDDLHPDFEDLPEAPFRGDPDLDAGLTPHWGIFQDPPVRWMSNGGSFLDDTSASTTWTAPDTVGSYYVHLYVRDDMDFYAYDNAGLRNLVASIPVRVLSVVQSVDLWWFGGQDVAWYSERVLLMVDNGPSTGYYRWRIDDGAEVALLTEQTGTANWFEKTIELSPTVSGAIRLKSVGDCTEEQKVTITWGYGTTSSSITDVMTFDVKVRQPYSLATPDGKQPVTHYAHPNPGGAGGYVSLVHYQVLDNFGQPVPEIVPVHEAFTDTDQTILAGENWPLNWGGQGGAWTGGLDLWLEELPDSVFNDNFGKYNNGETPTPLSPSVPLGVVAVDYWPGEWWIGTTVVGNLQMPPEPEKGVRVQTNDWKRWQDHGTHENITSPAP